VAVCKTVAAALESHRKLIWNKAEREINNIRFMLVAGGFAVDVNMGANSQF
jgi:hypothetical protein